MTHTDGNGLLALAEMIRASFAIATIGLGVNASLSIGIVSSDICSRYELVATADKALYECKRAGGNCARLATAQLCVA